MVVCIVFSFIAECEKLIRRMLQLEPAKRIPLNKVLEHRWMQGMELDLQPTSKMRVFGSNEHIFWNSHVLAAIQKMNYDVDRCKQVRKSLHVFRFPIFLFFANVAHVPVPTSPASCFLLSLISFLLPLRPHTHVLLSTSRTYIKQGHKTYFGIFVCYNYTYM